MWWNYHATIIKYWSVVRILVLAILIVSVGLSAAIGPEHLPIIILPFVLSAMLSLPKMMVKMRGKDSSFISITLQMYLVMLLGCIMLTTIHPKATIPGNSELIKEIGSIKDDITRYTEWTFIVLDFGIGQIVKNALIALFLTAIILGALLVGGYSILYLYKLLFLNKHIKIKLKYFHENYIDINTFSLSIVMFLVIPTAIYIGIICIQKLFPSAITPVSITAIYEPISAVFSSIGASPRFSKLSAILTMVVGAHSIFKKTLKIFRQVDFKINKAADQLKSGKTPVE